jgi:hypothetical protein
MFNLRGPQGQNPKTTCGPRTTGRETLPYVMKNNEDWLSNGLRVTITVTDFQGAKVKLKGP